MKILITGGSGFIGTNLISRLVKNEHAVINLDQSAPLERGMRPIWRQCDILHREEVIRHVGDFQPQAVIHLAARTDCDEQTSVEEGYRENTDGTRHVLEAIKATASVERVIITSSQFVCGPGYFPRHDEDFHPHTIYGRSKVITEELTRRADLPCVWTIIRPTNIWGPWHQRYIREFWKIADRGLYVHPGGQPVVRCYGYVGNLCARVQRILEIESSLVDRKVFYLGDPADDIYKWANAFCQALNGRSARKVPRPMLWTLGQIGEIISKFTGKPFYINASRYKSMVSHYTAPGRIEYMEEVLGPPECTLEEGVRETVAWIRSARG